MATNLLVLAKRAERFQQEAERDFHRATLALKNALDSDEYFRARNRVIRAERVLAKASALSRAYNV